MFSSTYHRRTMLLYSDTFYFFHSRTYHHRFCMPRLDEGRWTCITVGTPCSLVCIYGACLSWTCAISHFWCSVQGLFPVFVAASNTFLIFSAFVAALKLSFFFPTYIFAANLTCSCFCCNLNICHISLIAFQYARHFMWTLPSSVYLFFRPVDVSTSYA